MDDLIVKYNWRLIKTLWSALVLSKCSEKSSVVQLKERLIGVVRYYFYTARMKLDIPDECILAATKLLTFGHEPSTFQSQNKETVGEMKDQQKLTECNMNGYNTISESMHQFILERNLPRQHRLMAMTFMYVLLNPEQAVPPTIIRFFVNALISELPDEREIALKSILLIFKQIKKKYSKVTHFNLVHYLNFIMSYQLNILENTHLLSNIAKTIPGSPYQCLTLLYPLHLGIVLILRKFFPKKLILPNSAKLINR